MMQPTVLGTVPDEGMGRDAIHIAVLPTRTKGQMYPGQFVRVGKLNGEYTVGMAHPEEGSHGIIDPYLERIIPAGDLVWVLLLPGTVQDMRHHWSHPEIDALAENVTEGKLSEGAARRYLQGVAASIHVGIEEVLEAGDTVESKGEDYLMPGEGIDTHHLDDQKGEYWAAWSAIRKRPDSGSRQGNVRPAVHLCLLTKRR